MPSAWRGSRALAPKRGSISLGHSCCGCLIFGHRRREQMQYFLAVGLPSTYLAFISLDWPTERCRPTFFGLAGRKMPSRNYLACASHQSCHFVSVTGGPGSVCHIRVWTVLFSCCTSESCGTLRSRRWPNVDSSPNSPTPSFKSFIKTPTVGGLIHPRRHFLFPQTFCQSLSAACCLFALSQSNPCSDMHRLLSHAVVR